MERRKRVRISKVDAAIEGLKVGNVIPVEGALSYWRNRQALFHQNNPDAWVSIYTENAKAFAKRIY